MKHFSLIMPAVLIALATGLSSAQAQSSPQPEGTPASVSAGHRPALLRLGLGASLSGSGDYPVLKAHLEYAPQLGKHWRLGSRLAYVGGAQDYRMGNGTQEFTVPQSYRGVNAEQEIHWLPFGAGRTVELGIGGGVYAGYARQIGFTQAVFYLDANGNPNFSFTPSKEQGFHVGYIASLYVDFALDQNAAWRLGGRLALQNDTRANILPGGQLQLSRAF